MGDKRESASGKPDPTDDRLEEGQSGRSYQELVNTYTFLIPGYDYESIDQIACKYADFNTKVKKEVDLFKAKISEMPVISLIHIWSDLLHINNNVFSDRYHKMMNDLLENGLIECVNRRTGKLLSIGEFAEWSPITVIDDIRCYEQWSFEKREDYVKFFCEFSEWLSRDTFGYIHQAIDRDREITKQRQLHFDRFIEIIKQLNLRERVIAKIFYFGGTRSLEEVLSITIKLINHFNQTILFPTGTVKYSRPVFEDIKKMIGDRKTGYLFVGKHGEKINHTVPYRALKTVVTKLGFDPSFTFKEFTKNI
jgi:cobalamin biosynthesis Co2+ chelatase CbiK